MSESKLVEKLPQMLNMLNAINNGMTEVARTLTALERHGHTHPGDLLTMAGQVTQLQAIVGQLQSFMNGQAQAIQVNQTPQEPLTRSTALAAGFKDTAESLVRYVEGVDKQRQALDEHKDMSPQERAKRYRELIVNFFDPAVRPNSSGVLKPGWADLPLKEFDILAIEPDEFKDHMDDAFYTRTPDGEAEMFMFVAESGARFVIDFTAIEQYFDQGHFYMLWPHGSNLSYQDITVSMAPSIQMQVYPIVLSALNALVQRGLKQAA